VTRHSHQTLGDGLADDIPRLAGRWWIAAATVAVVGAAVLLYARAVATEPPVWADEFNGRAGAPPDHGRWSFETGRSWGNGTELQHYTAAPSNVSQDGRGLLRIVARKTDTGQGNARFTSARITTLGKFGFTYGRLEARIKLPAGTGILPAFWTVGSDAGRVPWPQCGEIDVVEIPGRTSRVAVYHVHGPDENGHDVAMSRRFVRSPTLAGAFHVYGIDWGPHEIQFRLDGKVTATITRFAYERRGGRWPVFQKPHAIVLSIAGGNPWTGPPDADSRWPATMLVDWLRVYRKAS
jgi:beta-glucanase (GH16 family)